MSSTPRTDEAEDRCSQCGLRFVASEDMQKLERELAEEQGRAKALYRSLAWAMRNLGSEPRLIRGQNDAYYTAWHEANDLVNECRNLAP